MTSKYTPWRASGADVLGEEPDKLKPSPIIFGAIVEALKAHVVKGIK